MLSITKKKFALNNNTLVKIIKIPVELAIRHKIKSDKNGAN